MEIDLKNLVDALEKDQLLLHYQPIVDLSTRKIVGVEALIRWQHPKYGLLYPSAFLPIADTVLGTSVFILPLFYWVFNQACQQAVAWEDAADRPYIAINISALQLGQEGLVETVRGAIDKLNLKGRIQLEITESAVPIISNQAMQEVLAQLSVSAAIAIDDFGSGCSNLQRLLEVCGIVEILKIDRVFVPRNRGDVRAIAVYKCLIGVARALDFKIVAEGIETSEQADILKDLGADLGQGFYFYRPVAADAIDRLLGCLLESEV